MPKILRPFYSIPRELQTPKSKKLLIKFLVKCVYPRLKFFGDEFLKYFSKRICCSVALISCGLVDKPDDTNTRKTTQQNFGLNCYALLTLGEDVSGISGIKVGLTHQLKKLYPISLCLLAALVYELHRVKHIAQRRSNELA